MDGGRFDALARGLAGKRSRRATLRLAVAGLIGGALGSVGRSREAAAACTKFGQKCESGTECCTGYCAGRGTKQRGHCTCPPEATRCGSGCCAGGQECVVVEGDRVCVCPSGTSFCTVEGEPLCVADASVCDV